MSAFIPFLPMERRHVKLCVKDDMLAKKHTPTEELISRVADELTYWPADKPLFSRSGCRKVSEKVDYVIMERYEQL